MSDELKPVFDEKIAASYIGKIMLVGLNFLDERGNLIRQEQIFGEILSVSKSRGIELKLQGCNEGKTYWLPPDLRSTSWAQPGNYTLKQTQEVVANPDLLGTWTVHLKAGSTN